MKLLQLKELKILLSVSSIDECWVIETREGVWTFSLYIRNYKDRSVSEYRLLGNRGQKREWNDLGAMLKFLHNHFDIKTGYFKLG